VIPARLLDLGRADYHDVWKRQLELLQLRQADKVPDTLVLVEHEPVITLGRSQKARANVLLAGDVPVVEIERGGDVTFHGPGQLVAYPIVKLHEAERDLHRFLRQLEEGVLRTLGELGIVARRQAGKTGVWIGEDPHPKKIASIGIACRKWVIFHGLALNVSTELAEFARIHPCGFDARVMTSVQAQGVEVGVAAVKPRLTRHLGDVLGRRFE
jgi:lipoyl(octanoyl) transferase